MSARPNDSKLAEIWRPSGNFDARAGGRRPDILLLHYTGMDSAEAAIDWLTREESKVSSHYLIDEAGVVTQMVAEEARAWHAGQSIWAGETDINSASIGIEIQNLGHASETGLPPYPEAQMRSLERLCLDILARHEIPPMRVLAHSDIAPTRKQDPGEHFDWGRLAASGIGHWVAPAPIGTDAGLGLGDEGEAVLALQKQLAGYGYGVEPTGTYGKGLENAVMAFQRHFRPGLVSGRADASTLDTLQRLLATLPAIA
jgi:N-acetylmuramoyl-L-alanine amidase